MKNASRAVDRVGLHFSGPEHGWPEPERSQLPLKMQRRCHGSHEFKVPTAVDIQSPLLLHSRTSALSLATWNEAAGTGLAPKERREIGYLGDISDFHQQLHLFLGTRDTKIFAP